MLGTPGQLLYGYTGMASLDPRYPPLSTDQLRAIWKRSPTPAVRLLLWEIHRLRLVAIHAHSYTKFMISRGAPRRMDTTEKILFDQLRDIVAREPAVKESETNHAKSMPK